MSDRDREKWDARYAGGRTRGVAPKPILTELAAALPTRGRALDVACGEGQGAVWLAERGMTVDAVDISEVGLATARALAVERGVAGRVRTVAHDLDAGLPFGCDAGYALVACVHFRPGPLMPALVAALSPRGLLLLEVLTAEARALGLPAPSARFLAAPGELLAGTAGLRPVFWREGVVGGRAVAQLLAQRAPAAPVTFSDGGA